MPLIRNGEETVNTWLHVETGEAGETPNGITVPLEAFLEKRDTLLARNTPLGVRLEPDDDTCRLAGDLDRLSLIEIVFPRYTDGRGYSTAQLLRRRLGYRGELRAVGHVLRDQLLYMHRSGFDAFETERAQIASVQDALGEFSSFYQPAADGHRHVFARRHT